MYGVDNVADGVEDDPIQIKHDEVEGSVCGGTATFGPWQH
jgi:hypothetical protein